MECISPEQLKNKSDCVIIDVREYSEFAAGAIPGAQLVPLSTVDSASTEWNRCASYVFVCKSDK